MSRLRQRIELSKTRRCVSDAIELTRKLGVRYIWIDALCVVQDDPEEQLNAMSRMSDIYSSAVFVIATAGTDDEKVDTCIDSSALEQPFSIFLDWSRPTVAKSFLDRLIITTWVCQGILLDIGRTRNNELDSHCEGIMDSDPKRDVEAIQQKVEMTDTRFDEASRDIDQGVHHVEVGNNFEALALFMKARERVSAFQLLDRRSWKIYAVVSANIALVYQMQSLPGIALDIAKASLAMQSKLPNVDCNSTLE